MVGRFLGRTVSEAAAFSAGVAIAPVLGPVVQALRNTINSRYAFVYPEAGVLAEGVAQGQVKESDARLWASFHGIGDDAFTALVAIANVGPGMAQAFNLWRRSKIDEAGFRRALKRLGLEKEWIDALWDVREEILAPADLARAIHRGLIPDPNLLKGTLPSGEGNVPAYPVYPIDAVKEAKGSGYDKDRLGVLVGLQGLPMGSHEAAQALFRGVLDENDYLRAIAEGNTRNEWAEAIKEQSRAIPSPTNYVEGRLRGWLNDAEMNTGAERHGMTPEDTRLLFLIHGRPLVHNQVFIGLIRGGVYDGPTTDIPAPFLKSLQESNLRPEWYNLVWAQRYHYPPFFQTVNLLNKGLIDEATARDWLTKQAYAPDAINTVVSAIGGGTGPKANTRVTSAQTKLLTGIEKAYVGGVLNDAEATAQMKQAGLSATTAAGVLAYWKQLKTLEASAPPPAV